MSSESSSCIPVDHTDFSVQPSPTMSSESSSRIPVDHTDFSVQPSPAMSSESSSRIPVDHTDFSVQLSPTVSSESPSRILVDHTYATDKHLPSIGEVIVVPLSQDLFGPSSTLGSARDLSSHGTRRNYYHAVVIGLLLHVYESTITLTVLPMPAYSAIDPISGLSSTNWLLSQPADYQKLHIPVPYEQIPPVTQPRPPFPTPAQFGDPIEAGGWMDRRPRWIQVVPMLTDLESTTKFKCYEPPVKLSDDEVRRLEEYGGIPSPVLPDGGTMPPFPPGGGSAAPGVPDASSLGKDAVPGSGFSQHPRQESQDSGYGGAAFGAGGSPVLQALYATDAVKQAFASLSSHSNALILDDDDDDDDDDDWEDRMDPITFARYYAPQNPHLAKIVQDHDDKTRERLNEGIARWAEEIQPGTV